MNDLSNKYLDLSKANFILANPNPQEIEIELWNSFRSGNREALNAIFEKYVRLLPRCSPGEQPGLLIKCPPLY